MKKYRITLCLKDGTEFEKVDYFENFEDAINEAKNTFDKSWAVISYEVEEVFK